MSHKILRPFIVKVSVLGYFPLIEPYRSMDYIADLKKFLLRLSDILDFQIVFMLFGAIHTWAILICIYLSVDPI